MKLIFFNVEVTNMCIDNKYVFLMGDFNARTCYKGDFVGADDFLTHHLSLDDTMDGSLNISSKLDRQIYPSTQCPKTK